jgi:hypothetical protein
MVSDGLSTRNYTAPFWAIFARAAFGSQVKATRAVMKYNIPVPMKVARNPNHEAINPPNNGATALPAALIELSRP